MYNIRKLWMDKRFMQCAKDRNVTDASLYGFRFYITANL